MKVQLPSIKELAKELARIKRVTDWSVDPNFDDIREGCETTFQITLGFDGSGYALQTGDNSFTGSAYGFKNWSVDYLSKHSNCLSLAKDILRQARELCWD